MSSSESSKGKSEPEKLWGIYSFLMVIFCPLFIVFCIIYAGIYFYLQDIRLISSEVRAKNLPGMLEMQQTLLNLESLRRYSEMVYALEDPMLRRQARNTAQEMANSQSFPGNPVFSQSINTAASLLDTLDQARSQSASAQRSLKHATVRVAYTLGVLTQQSQHLPNREEQEILTGLQKDLLAADMPESLKELATDLKNIVDKQGKLPAGATHTASANHVHALYKELIVQILEVQKYHQARAMYDHEARRIWQELNATLRTLSNELSSTELSIAKQSLERTMSEASFTLTAFYLSIFLIALTGAVFLFAIHHTIIQPLSLAAKVLYRIRHGQDYAKIPKVRIRELATLFSLLPQVNATLQELNTRSDRLEEEKSHYASMSYTDALTGIPNRRSFDLHLAHLAQNLPFSVLMIDVDLFKRYNDALGHQAGDECLKRIATMLRESLRRSSDKVFRYGGEEFAIILEQTPAQYAHTVAQRIMQAVHDICILHPDSPLAKHVTLSIGVACCHAQPCDAQLLVESADAALYQAKSRGRNQCAVSAD